MLAMANKTAEAADFIDKLSERTGINREELQRWKYAAGQSGADVGKLEVGIKKLSETMMSATDGSKQTVDGFKKLGISLEDLKTKSQSEIFDRVMKGLADMPAGAERNALGNKMLGKSYTELLPLLNAGSQGMDELKTRADKLGIVMSEEAVKANVKYGDTMDDVKQSLGMVTQKISTSFLPILQEILNWVLAHMPEIQAFCEKAFNALGAAIKWANDNADWLIPTVAGLAAALGTLQIINTVNGLMVIWKASTFAQTLAQHGLNAALTANPIGLIVIGIGLLIAGIILLWTKCDWFRNGIIAIFNGLKDIFFNVVIPYWQSLAGIVTGVFGSIWNSVSSVIGNVKNIFMNLIDFVKNVFTGNWKGAWDNIKNIFGNIFQAIGTIWKMPINAIIEGINGFLGGLSKIKIPDWVPKIGGKGISIPKIPMLAKGTDYFQGGYAIVGEQGPELVQMPRGSKVNSNAETMAMAGGTTINFNGNYSFRDQNDMNYMLNQAAIRVKRRQK